MTGVPTGAPTRPEPAGSVPVPFSVSWRTWSTYVFLATEDPALLRAAESIAKRVLAEVDRTCSRFRDDSDLVRANAAAGSWVPVDPLLAHAVSVALEAAEHTDGLVDPCLGRTLVALGYDADLGVVQARRPDAVPLAVVPPRPGAWREVRVDLEGAVRVPEGVALDLGATGKAWASDLVAASVVDELGCHVVVSLGGDVRADGPADTTPRSWRVALTERPDDEDPDIVEIADGGLATSSTLARRWSAATGVAHHVVDPRTGGPAAEVWRTVTATGPTCVAANVATTAALVLGADALPWLRERQVSARLVHASGAVATHRWPTDEPDAAVLPFQREGAGS